MNTKHLLMMAALMASSTACSDGGTTPIEADAAFDARLALADYQALSRILGSPALASFQAMGARLTIQSASAVAGLTPRNVLGGRLRNPVANAIDLAATLAGAPPLARVEIISAEARGTTFVYDPEADQYVAAPERTGAPDNGVRFILYAVDEATGRPDVNRETGHADLFDEGVADEPPISLRFVVVNDGATRMDYSVTVGGSETAGIVAVSGFVSDSEGRLDFGITVSTVRDGGTEATKIQFGLAMEDRGFQASATMTGVDGESGHARQVDVVVRHGQHIIQVSIANNGSTMNASFVVNGHVLATASGDPQNPVFQGGSGAPLTGEEMQALGRIMGLTNQVFRLFSVLMDPADDLIRLGIAL